MMHCWVWALFSIERAGSLPISGLIDLVYTSGKTREELEVILSKHSGLKGYLGTNKFTEIEQKITQGDVKASLIVDAMAYQIVKEIGSLYAVSSGNLDGLIITGGLAKSKFLMNKLESYLNFIDNITIYPGSFELEALANGVLRVLSGKEAAKEYL